MQAQDARPPYVTFAKRSEEDREASIKAGKYTTKDVDYAFITPQGSKDKFEYRAEEWFANLRQQVREQRFPQEWLDHFSKTYAAWQNNEEIPLDGTPVKNWPVASPAQVEMMVRLGIKTVEDMAGANEEALSRLGMGGRLLKQQAENWIRSAQSSGTISAELTKLQVENETMKQENAELRAITEELGSRVQALTIAQANVKPL